MASTFQSYIEENMNLIDDYLPTDYIILEKTPLEKMAIIYLSCKNLEKAKLKNSEENTKLKTFLAQIKLPIFFRRTPDLSLGKFILALDKLNLTAKNSIIKNEVEQLRKIYNFYTVMIKFMIYLNEKYDKGNLISKKFTIFDQHITLRTIFYIFTMVKRSIEPNYELYYNGKILSLIYDLSFEEEENGNKIVYDYAFYFGAFKEMLHKLNFKEENKPFDLNLFSEKIKFYLNEITTKLNQKIPLEEVINEFENDLLNQQDEKNNTDINELFYLKSILLEDFEERERKIESQLSSLGQEVKWPLDWFMKDLNNYEYLDIDMIFRKNYKNAVLLLKLEDYEQQKEKEDYNYLKYFQNFHKNLNKYLLKNKKANLFYPVCKANNNDEEFKPDIPMYNYQKTLFLKFLNYYLTEKQLSLFSNSTPLSVQNKLDLDPLFINLQYFAFYSLLTLQYIEDKKTLITVTYEYLLYLSENPNQDFSILITHKILTQILKLQKEIPFNIMNIFKKYLHDILAFILFKSQVKYDKKFYYTLSKDFYTYIFEIIDKISIEVNKEKIFNGMKKVVNFDNGSLVEEKYLDLIIIYVFAIQMSIEKEKNFNKELLLNNLEKVKMAYFEQKKKTFVPDIYELFILEKDKKALDYEYLKKIFDIMISEEEEIIDFFPCLLDFNTTKYASRIEYNSIFTHSPGKKNFAANESMMLNKKRIRMLTPTIAEKTMLTSPLICKIQPKKSNSANKPVSAFKNLSFN